MSTILRSLRRLEKESAAGGGKAALPLTGTHQAMNRTARFDWLKGRLVRGGLLALVLIACGLAWYVYSRPVPKLSGGPPQAHPASRVSGKISPAQTTARSAEHRPQLPVAPADRPREQMAAVTDLQKGAVSIKPIGQSDGAALKPALPVGSHSSDSARISKPAAGPQAGPPQTNRPAASTSEVQRGADISAAEATGTAPLQKDHAVLSSSGSANAGHANEGKSPPVRDAGPFANAARMSDGRLKVQAIVWSSKADDRMAVINSRIVREGSVIDGFTIVGIGEDAVYVKEGGRVLKVPFGRP